MKFCYPALSLLLLLAFTFFPSKTNATHIVGSDISYKCTGTPGLFEVTLVIFRKCEGGATTLCPSTCGAACVQTMQVQGADPSCTSSTFNTISLNLVSVRDADTKPYCPTAKNACNNMGCVTAGTYTPAVERYEFKGFANVGPTSGIPASCCNVRFSWELCCRNSNIATGAADANFYVDAVINRCQSFSPCNSSPSFGNDPFITLCGNDNIIYNNSAYDPDGDSLSFAFTPALQGFGSSVSYTPPFAYDKPMPWTGNANGIFPTGIRCDPVNGDIMFTPPNAGGMFSGVIAIEVNQWKKINSVPTKLGTTRRDIQMTIRGDCAPNYSPQLITTPWDTNALTPKTQWEVCEGQQLCFTVIAKDTYSTFTPIIDTTYMSWDSTLAGYGATFLPTYNPANRTTTGPREDSYQFCWTPTQSMARSNPYMFSVAASDNKCPNPGRLRRGFSVKVNKLADLSITKTNKLCGKWQIGYTKNDASQTFSSTSLQIAKEPFDYSFSAGSFTYTNTAISPDISFKKGGRYLIKVTAQVGNCPKIFYDTLTVDTIILGIQQIAVANVTCNGTNNGSILITPWGSTSAYQFKLDNGTFQTSNSFSNLTAGTYTVTVKDSTNCNSIETVTVQQPTVISSTIVARATTCNETYDGKLTITATGGGIPPYTYALNSSVFTTTNQWTNLGGGAYQIIIKDSLLCEKTFVSSIVQTPKVYVGITKTDITCFNKADGSIIATPIIGKSPFTYNVNGGTYTSNSVFTGLGPRMYVIGMRDSLGCSDSVFVLLQEPAKIVAGTISGPTTTLMNATETYSATPQPGLNFIWAAEKGTILSGDTTPTINIRWDTSGIGKVGYAVYSDTTCGDTTGMVVSIGAVGLTELSQSWGLNIYPNPAKNSLNIILQKLPERTQIELYDVQGKLVLQQELKLSQQLNIEKLAAGVYILKIGAWSGQVVKE